MATNLFNPTAQDRIGPSLRMAGFCSLTRIILMFGLWGAGAVSAYPGQDDRARPRPETQALGCSGCHGTEEGGDSLIPPLDGMPTAEFIRAMRDFKSGKRVSSIMNRIAKGYEDSDFLALSAYFAKGRR